MRLHITNGDSAGDMLKTLFPADAVLPWRDTLHEGPVSRHCPTEERAAYLSSRGWGHEHQIRALFAERARLLAGEWDEIVLWFEHDLYDELQWIQVLDLLYARPGVSLIRTCEYLGEMMLAQLAACEPTRRPASAQDFEQARLSWLAFTGDTPAPLVSIASLRRLCEEYPWTTDGCSRTERAILRLCAAGVTASGALFAAYQETEQARWLGDWPFFDYVEALQQGAQPLLDAHRHLTVKGRAVLDGSDDRILGNGIDRWLGGVRLQGPDSPWRWDSSTASFRRASGSTPPGSRPPAAPR